MEIESLNIDAEEQSLRDLGRETDMNEGRPLPKDESATPAPEPRAAGEAKPTETQPAATDGREQTPDNSEIESKQVEQQQREPKTEPLEPKSPQKDPVTGKFVKKEGQETPYSRAQKEEERKDRSWQALQAEKEQIRREKAEFQEQMRLRQLEATRSQNQPLKKDGLTLNEYYDGAMRLEKAGDFENATQAYRTVLELQQAESQRAAQLQQAEVEYSWRQQMEHALKVNPEIGDPNSPINQRLEPIIAANPWLYHIPEGFAKAAFIADVLTRLESFSELQDENESLRAELEKTRGKSQPLNGRVTGAPRGGAKSFDEMSLDEMESDLKRITAEADSYR